MNESDQLDGFSLVCRFLVVHSAIEVGVFQVEFAVAYFDLDTVTRDVFLFHAN